MEAGKIRIECPICEWEPDGKIYWQCSCGNRWNTFETKAKCPDCGNQWEDTRCPGCGKSSQHSQWYKDISIETQGDPPEIAILKTKKRKLESRLIALGIRNYRVSHLPYLDFSKEEFQDPFEVGCRMLILYAISYSVHNLSDRKEIVKWLNKENLWSRTSPKEKEFFNKKKPSEDELMNLSWRIESTLVLAWALNLINEIHDIDKEESELEMEELFSKIPEIGSEVGIFLNNLNFRNIEEIYEENLLNELATTYFRDLMFSGEEDETKINRFTSFERHQTLNWMRKFMGMENWDETDTST